MTVERIKPRSAEKVKTPQCCVKTKDFTPYQWVSSYVEQRKEKANLLGFQSDQCLSQASFLIDGQYYCTKHAGGVALSILLKAGARDIEV